MRRSARLEVNRDLGPLRRIAHPRFRQAQTVRDVVAHRHSSTGAWAASCPRRRDNARWSRVTAGNQNPTLTILALAMRSSERLADRMKKGEI